VEADHEIIVVLNKTDLASAEPERVKQQITDVVGLDSSDAISISAKTGDGVPELLEALVNRISPPTGYETAPLSALLVDSWYDAYLGVVILVRVHDGVLTKGMKVRMMAAGTAHAVEQVGTFKPKPEAGKQLGPGEIGYFTSGIKDVAQTAVGDTITSDRKPSDVPLPGFKPSVPVVFCGLFPVDSGDYPRLRESLTRLKLNDSSFHFEAESSAALGFGFRCGFLGLLHLEIVQERLSREFDLDLIATAPSVVYRIHGTNGKVTELHNPVDMPDPVHIDHLEEPWILATILVPDEFLGSVLKLCEDRRGEQVSLGYSGNRAVVTYRLPLNEVVFDFYDRLKSGTSGYASFDYEVQGYREGDLVRMTIMVNGDPVDALSMVVYRASAESRGRALCERLKELIPRQMFQIAIQAALGGRIIARETVRAIRKDVTAKCYGGDISRKRKLLDKQKKGKKRMRTFGKVEIPQEAFIAALKMDSD
jgi:GTP-binding protein LepA